MEDSAEEEDDDVDADSFGVSKYRLFILVAIRL